MKPDICEHNTNCSVCSNILEKYQIVVNPQINLSGSIKTEWIFILSKLYKTQNLGPLLTAISQQVSTNVDSQALDKNRFSTHFVRLNFTGELLNAFL